MLSTLLSIFGGGLTGIFGSLISNIFNFFTQKQVNEKEIALKELDLKRIELERDLMMKEAEINLKIKQVGIEGEIDIEEARAFTESQKDSMTPLFKESFMEKLMDKGGTFNWIIAGIVAFLFGLVDFLKHIMRPGITIFLMIVFSGLVYKSWQVLEQSGYKWDSVDALKIVLLCVDAVIYLTLTCVGWYFADRRIAKFAYRLMDGNLKK